EPALKGLQALVAPGDKTRARKLCAEVGLEPRPAPPRARSEPPLAKADIFDVWSYNAVDSQDAAGRVEQAIYDACAFLAEGPLGGHSGPDLITNPLRFWT